MFGTLHGKSAKWVSLGSRGLPEMRTGQALPTMIAMRPLLNFFST